MSKPQVLAGPIDHARRWISDLARILEVDDERIAYRTLRAVLHALRDALIPNEAVDLGAQLPLIIRGVYYEGWDLSKAPIPTRHAVDLFARISRELVFGVDPAAEDAAPAVFLLLSRHVTRGEVEQVRGMLTQEPQDLWPALPEIQAGRS